MHSKFFLAALLISFIFDNCNSEECVSSACPGKSEQSASNYWKLCLDGSPTYLNKDGKEICSSEHLNNAKIATAAEELRSKHMLRLDCPDEDITLKISVGVVMNKGGFYEEAVAQFTKLITQLNMKSSPCSAIYYERADAQQMLGNNDAALDDYTEALRIAEPKDVFQVYEARAALFSAMEKWQEAVEDYTKAIEILPSYRLYLKRGIAYFFTERYMLAYTDFKDSLHLQPRQSYALHYQALCLYHMRKFHQAVKIFKAVLQLDPGNFDIMQSLAQAYIEMGDFKSALDYYNKFLSIDPSRGEIQQLKGMLLYKHGDVNSALEAFKSCIKLRPYNHICQYMKSACYASLGKFYPAIKEISKIMVARPVRKSEGGSEYPTTMYLREWCRYLHSRLDHNASDVSIINEVNSDYIENWCRGQPFKLQNYTEQPGLQPHIKDVEQVTWENQSKGVQKLLCAAYSIGENAHNQGSYFYNDQTTPNVRLFTATGLAAIEIAQLFSDLWKSHSSKCSKQVTKTSWRDTFDIAVKWTRLVDVERPVFWVDTSSSLAKPYVVQRISLIQDNSTRHRYESYLPKFYKLLASDLSSRISSLHIEKYRDDLDPVESFQYLHDLNQKHWDVEYRGPWTVGSKVASKKDSSQKKLDGYSLILQPDINGKLMLLLDEQISYPKTQQYHFELDYIWQKIEENRKQSVSGKCREEQPNSKQMNSESLLHLILSLAYYFFNLMPLSSSTSNISYTTALGLVLALGKETEGRVPEGKEIYMEALTNYDPDKFKVAVKSWIQFKSPKSCRSVNTLKRVKQEFHDYRKMLEVLQLDLSNKCKTFCS